MAPGYQFLQHGYGFGDLRSILSPQQQPRPRRFPLPLNGNNSGRSCKASFSSSFSSLPPASPTTTSTVERENSSVNQVESQLIDALIGIQGRGRRIAPEKLQSIFIALQALESTGGIEDPTSSPLIEGRWQLLFTTRPGTASPIQRAFIGVDTFVIFQDIFLRETDDPRVCNIVRFSESIGELKVEAAASIESTRRILFQFDRAAFSFKFLPFKVPYPVPFRLLGDEAKGWLDTWYLSPSGNIRISKGNKGTTFVLQKQMVPRQHLLQAISTRHGVVESIEEVLPLNPTDNTASLEHLGGKWRLLWSLQAPDANWLQKATSMFQSWQIVDAENGRIENLVEFIPGIRLRAKATSKATSSQRRDVIIEGASLELGNLEIPFKIQGSGFTEVLYLDNKIRITRGSKGSMFVHIRDD